MASSGYKISELDNKLTMKNSDCIPIVDTDDINNLETKKITFESFKNAMIKVEEFSSGELSFTAGTIGTRGVQASVNIARSGYTPIAYAITYSANTNAIFPMIFFNSSRTAVYVNLYRASSAAFSSTSDTVKFVVIYLPN